jgi:hypothetical protein
MGVSSRSSGSDLSLVRCRFSHRRMQGLNADSPRASASLSSKRNMAVDVQVKSLRSERVCSEISVNVGNGSKFIVLENKPEMMMARRLVSP